MLLAKLIVPEGHPVERKRVKALVESMRRVGQLEPVVVRVPTSDDRSRLGLKAKGYERILVAGFHRAAAVRELCGESNTTEILALETYDSEREDGVTEDEVRIDENLIRSHMDKRERDKALAERAEMIAKRKAEATKTGPRERSDSVTDPNEQPKRSPAFKASNPAITETAAAAGVSPRTVRRAVAAVQVSATKKPPKPSHTPEPAPVPKAPPVPPSNVKMWTLTVQLDGDLATVRRDHPVLFVEATTVPDALRRLAEMWKP